MSILTFIGAGQMASTLTFPVRKNGHEVRLVGTPLDREIIEEAKKSGFHITLKRQLPEGKELDINAIGGPCTSYELADGGVVSLDDYPLLIHVDSIINEGQSVQIPWDKFTFTVK